MLAVTKQRDAGEWLIRDVQMYNEFASYYFPSLSNDAWSLKLIKPDSHTQFANITNIIRMLIYTP